MAEPDTEPVVVRYADVERRTWGDEEAGRLPDWFYADSARLNLNIVGMAPNGAVLHSGANRAVFGADELFYVLEGKMVQAPRSSFQRDLLDYLQGRGPSGGRVAAAEQGQGGGHARH